MGTEGKCGISHPVQNRNENLPGVTHRTTTHEFLSTNNKHINPTNPNF